MEPPGFDPEEVRKLMEASRLSDREMMDRLTDSHRTPEMVGMMMDALMTACEDDGFACQIVSNSQCVVGLEGSKEPFATVTFIGYTGHYGPRRDNPKDWLFTVYDWRFKGRVARYPGVSMVVEKLRRISGVRTKSAGIRSGMWDDALLSLHARVRRLETQV